MKAKLLVFLLMLGNVFLFTSCARKENVKKTFDTEITISSLKSRLLYQEMSSSDFNADLNKFQKLVRDSLIDWLSVHKLKKIDSSGYINSLKVNSMSATIKDAFKSSVLVQTVTQTNGVIDTTAFSVAGYNGIATQIGRLQQLQPYHGITSFRIYIAVDNMRLAATNQSALTEENKRKPNLYVVCGSVMHGDLVSLQIFTAPSYAEEMN